MQVCIVGGSIGGLTAALVLEHMGHTVDVFERSSHPLAQRGAGIGLLPETSRYLTDVAGTPLDDISISTSRIRYLSRDGNIIHDEDHPYRFSSWNTVYRRLLNCFDPDRYHLAHEMIGWDSGGSSVTARFVNGAEASADLLVCADGVNSSSRSRMHPGVTPRYAGYVAWRGMMRESELDPAVRDRLSDAITYHVYANSHILVYPIPGPGGETEPGHRSMNFVWYRNYMHEGDLEDLMTDADGVLREVSLPPGLVPARHVDEMRAHATARLPRDVATVVCGAPEPFVQVVFDLDIPSMTSGRVCLLGDAAYLARPHAAAGTAKAADDAWALATAVTRHATVEEALREYEVSQMKVGRDLIERTEQIGRRSQVENSWVPGGREFIFGLRGPGS